MQEKENLMQIINTFRIEEAPKILLRSASEVIDICFIGIEKCCQKWSSTISFGSIYVLLPPTIFLCSLVQNHFPFHSKLCVKIIYIICMYMVFSYYNHSIYRWWTGIFQLTWLLLIKKTLCSVSWLKKYHLITQRKYKYLGADV